MRESSDSWLQAQRTAGILAPAAEWRRRLAQALYQTGEFVFVTLFTCPPNQPLAGEGEFAPLELAGAIAGFMARRQAAIERRGLGSDVAPAVGSNAYAPLEAEPNDPKLAALVLKELRAATGAEDLVNTWMLDSESAVLGFISLGTKVASRQALERYGEELSEVGRVAGKTLHAALELVAGCGARAPRTKKGSHAALTRREREIAGLVASGLTDLNIAQRLGISEVTVGTHLTRIFQKVSVHTRTELVAALGGQLLASPSKGGPGGEGSDPEPGGPSS